MGLLKFSVVFFIVISLSACGGNSNLKSGSESVAVTLGDQIDVLNVQHTIKVVASGTINSRALRECNLQSQLPELLEQEAGKKGIAVNRVKTLDTQATGYNLLVEFTQIVNGGNVFFGHRKYTQIHVTLFKDGQKVSEADAGRRSGGGFAGGFKGACAVLGRTLEANAKDVALWLSNPVNNDRLGDL